MISHYLLETIGHLATTKRQIMNILRFATPSSPGPDGIALVEWPSCRMAIHAWTRAPYGTHMGRNFVLEEYDFCYHHSYAAISSKYNFYSHEIHQMHREDSPYTHLNDMKHLWNFDLKEKGCMFKNNL